MTFCSMDPVASKELAKEKLWEVTKARFEAERRRMAEEQGSMVSDDLIAPTTGTLPLTNESRESTSNEWTAPATNESIAPRQMSDANSRQPVNPRPAAQLGDQVGILSSRGHEVHHRPSARFSNQHQQPPQSVEQYVYYTIALKASAQSFTLDE
jgi:hypothetical protein